MEETTSIKQALEEFGQQWEFSPERLQRLEAFENFVYEFGGVDPERILRISHRSHRSAEAIEAEFHWVDYLCSQGMNIASTIPTSYGQKVVISNDGEYLAVVINKVPGTQMSAVPRDQWTADYFVEWGRTIGQMHRLTGDYKSGPWSRMTWNEDRYVVQFSKFVADQDQVYRKHWNELLSELEELPKNANNYGLIHDDLHTKNFCMDNGRLQVFDTDDCKRHWFMGDLVSALHSIVLSPWIEEHPVEKFLENFWLGYLREFRVLPEDVLNIPLLLRARSAVVFGALCLKWDLDNLNSHEQFVFDQLSGSLRNQEPLVKLSDSAWLKTLPTPTS